MWILDKLKEQFINSLQGFLTLFYEGMNDDLGGLSERIAENPETWENGGPWNLVTTLSVEVMVPVAGIILTYILCLELMHMVMEKNNMRDFDTTQLFMYILKMAICVVVVNHALEIVSGCMQVGIWMAQRAGTVIDTTVQPGADTAQEIADLLRNDPNCGFGDVLTIWLASLIAWLIGQAVILMATLAVFGRLMQMLAMSSVAPIPLASMGNKEWSSGQNYIKSLMAIALQGFLMLFMFALYIILAQSNGATTAHEVIKSLFASCGWGILLCVMLFSTGTLSKSIVGAH